MIIGAQAMMLKEEFARDGVFRTLEKLAAIGYRSIEVSQVPMVPETVAELSRAQHELSMDVSAISCLLAAPEGSPFDALDADFAKIVADAKALESQHVRIGILTYEALASRARLEHFCDTIEEYGKRLADEGLTLSYHNHHVDFMRFDGDAVLDVIVERCPNVFLEIDVHWVQRGGLDPVRTLAAYGDRVALVHLKDYRIGHVPEEAFARYFAGERGAVHETFPTLVQFAEIGEGTLDFPAIIAEAERIGVQHAFVEQDQRYGRTSLEALQTSYSNVVAMGFGDRF
ncbi:sugar phosphate isomerase/epimerase family protein [Microbacterium xanthum]|uniref:sugar phosphate isomerase/epimerase family protein n=1 Tax=Microbacterium xanthum TaxID=3079794 RepID=UPI002AD4BC15|nr:MULTISPECIES: sugar phosphate isomerase/epimerase [unclassified Microbacterium]MDZ8171157.1 sugar phosphate isomerase/epimerase [Microbacterium sp. KSW-48]MDZ8201674.1 sugar phosphate isomerase/epimerase [Microbacterium sp. SSW1-59]